MSRVGIVGAGAWGTALAVVARRAGHAVVLWAHDPAVAEAIERTRSNPAYLPGVPLDDGVRATAALADAADADLVLLVTPAQRLRGICTALARDWRTDLPAIICAKGIEQGSGALPTAVVEACLPGVHTAVLSGPTFAREVAAGLPAAATVAASGLDLADRVAGTLAGAAFRLYSSDDPAGVQVGGAVKNVIAIAAGVVEGRGLGDNARAALVTRGLAEATRLAAALGGRPQTLMGLAGLGDLTLTCSARQSRNFSLGIALGEGLALGDVLAGRRSVAEGVWTAASVVALARRHGVEMPICAAVDAVLRGAVGIGEAIRGLLMRPLRTELRG